MRKRIKYYIGFLVVSLAVFGLYKGVLWLREWAEPAPVLAMVAGIPSTIKIQNQPVVVDPTFGDYNIYAESVSSSWPGFVAVFDFKGELVGSSNFIPSGTKTNVRINLVNQYKTGDRLALKLLRDNGDGIFNLVEDFPIKDKLRREITVLITIK